MDEGRKRVLLIAASILAARDLANTPRYGDSHHRFDEAISEAIYKAEAILREIDRRWPTKPEAGKRMLGVKGTNRNDESVHLPSD